MKHVKLFEQFISEDHAKKGSVWTKTSGEKQTLNARKGMVDALEGDTLKITKVSGNTYNAVLTTNSGTFQGDQDSVILKDKDLVGWEMNESIVNEKLDAKVVAQKVMKELDTYAQLHVQYQPKEVLAAIEDVLKKYKDLYGGKLVQKVAVEIRHALLDTGNLANDAYRHFNDVDHIIIGALTESTLNEDLRSELKSYIKKNKKEIDDFADQDDWDAIYKMVLNDFNVQDGSDDADELKTIFNIVY